MDFDKTILFDNINYLIKKKDIKIGELEEYAGVSPGYISRASKEGGSKPGIDFIMKAARKLDVTLDTLLYVNLNTLSANENYLIKFLQKLVSDTVHDRLNWKREKAEQLNRMETDMNGNVDHPLFSFETFSEVGESEYPEEVSRVVFTSQTFDVHTAIYKDCFFLRLKNNTYLYIMNLCKSVRRIDDPNAYVTEVWMHAPNSIPQYICRNRDSATYGALVDSLYYAIEESAKHPKIEGGIQEAIDAYMKDDFGDPFVTDDDDLPF